MLKSIIIVIAFILAISVTASAQSNAKIIKALDIMSEDQINQMADSTGMISVSELCSKLMSFTPNTYYINYGAKEKTINILKEANQHMIDKDIYIFAFGWDQNAQMIKYKNSYGKMRKKITHTIEEPILYIGTSLAKKFKFVFATNN